MNYNVNKKEDPHINLTIQILNIKDEYKVCEIITKLQDIDYLQEIGGGINSNNSIIKEFREKKGN